MYNSNTDSLGLILDVEVFFSLGHCSGALCMPLCPELHWWGQCRSSTVQHSTVQYSTVQYCTVQEQCNTIDNYHSSNQSTFKGSKCHVDRGQHEGSELFVNLVGNCKLKIHFLQYHRTDCPYSRFCPYPLKIYNNKILFPAELLPALGSST